MYFREFSCAMLEASRVIRSLRMELRAYRLISAIFFIVIIFLMAR